MPLLMLIAVHGNLATWIGNMMCVAYYRCNLDVTTTWSENKCHICKIDLFSMYF